MDYQIRLEAFSWLEQKINYFEDDTIPRTVLAEGFIFQGQQIVLIGPKGIWKPKVLSLPISITTTFDNPYNDDPNDEFLHYKYRGTNPNHPDNVGLREIMQRQLPLIYFWGTAKGKYIATWPVFIIGDNKEDLAFTVAVDEAKYSTVPTDMSVIRDNESTYYRRSYLTTNARIRLHQKSFRERVLLAYQNQCAFCKLRHRELLDAAHIIPDSHESGIPIVQNGVSLCKIHHAVFDSHIVGITPDYSIHVRTDVLNEIDGPMLKYGIQSLENNTLLLPRNKTDWPDRERLAERYQQFEAAG